MSFISTAEPDAMRNIMVAVDGSETAHKAFRFTLRLLQPTDKLIVAHCAVPGKAHLPFDLRAENIAETYAVKLVARLPSTRYEVVCFNRPPASSTKDAVCAFVNERRPFLLAVGCTGRKGPREDPTVLGSTTDYSLRAARCHALVVKAKSTVPARDEPVVFMVGVDGSKASRDAFQAAITFATSADRVVVVHIVNPDEQASLPEGMRARAVRAEYERLLEESKFDGVFQEFEKRPGEAVNSMLLRLCDNEIGADVVAVGADGLRAFLTAGKSMLGSVPDYLVRHSRAAVLVTRLH